MHFLGNAWKNAHDGDFDEARQIKLGIELNLNKELYQVYIKQEER